MPFNGGEIRLFGKPISGFEDMTVWRKQVMYVPQTKIEFPGSPKSLLQRIASFQVWKGEKVDSPSLSQMEVDVEELIQDWGLSSRLLDSDWKTLSGGESQRLLLAISLASRPKVILLDESTSSLDLKTKLEVENSIETYCKKHGMCAIWITHDQSQQNRMQLNGRSHNGHHYSAA
jgi:ABC-type iron transport system FetAB ATPase subunit